MQILSCYYNKEEIDSFLSFFKNPVKSQFDRLVHKIEL
jgi:hypothetical protein